MKTNIQRAACVASTAIKPTGTVATKKTTQAFRKTKTVVSDPKVLADVVKLQAILAAPVEAKSV